MDLGGLNIELSETAFGHWVSDESLKALDIHRGDIALVDPARRILEDGNLILVSLDGWEVIKRLREKNHVWYMETANGAAPQSVPLSDSPIQGVVLGVLRLFTNAKAVNFRGTGAEFGPTREQPSSAIRKSTRSRKSDAKPMRPGRRRRPLILAGEQSSEYRMSEVGQEPGYSA